MTPHRLLRYLVLYFIVLLQGCVMPQTPPPGAPPIGPDGDELLVKLKHCLREVRSARAESFTSPCATLDVTALIGIPIGQLKKRLGAPGISSDDNVHAPRDPSSLEPPYEARWAFYKLPAGALGGGPELQCVSPDRATCRKVRWVETE